MGGNDTDSRPRNNRSGQMRLRHAGPVQERANELQDLSIVATQRKEVEDWATDILPRIIKIKIILPL